MERNWLALSLTAQGFDQGFVERAKAMGLETLEDVLSTAPQELMANAAFRYEWLQELIAFLKKRGLLHLLQPVPGRGSE